MKKIKFIEQTERILDQSLPSSFKCWGSPLRHERVDIVLFLNLVSRLSLSSINCSDCPLCQSNVEVVFFVILILSLPRSTHVFAQLLMLSCISCGVTYSIWKYVYVFSTQKSICYHRYCLLFSLHISVTMCIFSSRPHQFGWSVLV